MISAGVLQAVDWTKGAGFTKNPLVVKDRPLQIAWVTSPPGIASGGHQNIFRFVKALEDAGHECTMYFWDWKGSVVNGDHLRKMLAPVSAYPHLKAEFLPYSGAVDRNTDAIIATAWETAYPVFLDPSNAKRFYFVQDFEPQFYPVGVNSTLASNTYRFGFHGLTAGGWLRHKLGEDYGMAAHHYDFAADTSLYHVTNNEPRNDVFFYARPNTPRRAFELGVTILEQVKRERPETVIHFAGQDIDAAAAPFDFVNHAAMDISALNDVYNQCGAGLVLSLTNMSLLPLELLAAGVAPVVNDGPNNVMVSDNPNIHYSAPAPGPMSAAILNALDESQKPGIAALRSQSVQQHSWADAGKQLVNALEEVMRG